jgi:hypothetical protein
VVRMIKAIRRPKKESMSLGHLRYSGQSDLLGLSYVLRTDLTDLGTIIWSDKDPYKLHRRLRW